MLAEDVSASLGGVYIHRILIIWCTRK